MPIDIEVNRSVSLAVETCIVCDVLHALPRGLLERYRQHGGFWQCPNGHSQGWAEGQDQRVERQLRNQIAELESRLRAANARRDQLANDVMDKTTELKSLKKRVKGGVCPECRRTFQNVQRHMETQH